MSDILPCDCGYAPELVDCRTFWQVRCNNCNKFSSGQDVMFLDHIDWSDLDCDDDAAADKRNEMVFDAVRWDDLEKSAVEVWNAARTITRLRAELAEARDKALDEAATELDRLDGHGEWHEAAQAIRALKSPKPQEATMSEGVGG